MFDLLVRGGRAVLPDGVRAADIAVRNGRIAAIGDDLGPAHTVLDATHRLVLPGGVDSHCHMDQPPWEGMTTADDFRTATLSALCGGTTTVIPFAMQLRGQSLRDCVTDYRRRAQAGAHVDYAFHLIVGDPTEAVLHDELPQLVAEGCTSLKLYMTYEGLRLDDGELLRVLDKARALGVLAMVHAENDAAVKFLTQRLVAAGRTAMRYHATARPALGDREAAHRAITFAELIEVPILVAHVSAGIVVEEIRRAQARGVPILAETCPQYLFLSRDDLAAPGMHGARCVCTPPPRTRADQAAVYAGLLDGTLSVFSSDHSPWRWADKIAHGDRFDRVPNGIPGIETRLALLFSDAVQTGRMSLETFVERTATAPARLFGLAPRKGALALGADADIVLWDAEREVTIRNTMLHHACDYTPYEGRRVRGWPVTTIARGAVLWHDGEVRSNAGRGEFLPCARPLPPVSAPQSWLAA
jgi:dihydropyrimidinase